MALSVAVVIAARREAERLPLLLADLQQAPGGEAPCSRIHEVLVVDGESPDRTARVAALAGAAVRNCSPGRGQQLALGAAQTEAPWLLFLHADVRLQPGWQQAIERALALADAPEAPPCAWWFELAIDGPGWALRLLEAAVSWRSRVGQMPYGDQGLLVSRELYQQAGGFAPLALMEDLDLVLRLRRLGRLRSLGAKLLVDGRRWHQLGVLAVSWRNWRLRRAWRRGADSLQLARQYNGGG